RSFSEGLRQSCPFGKVRYFFIHFLILPYWLIYTTLNTKSQTSVLSHANLVYTSAIPMQSRNNTPTILVVLGATGDLMTKKIVPALFNLHEKKKLPRGFQLMGVSRRD